MVLLDASNLSKSIDDVGLSVIVSGTDGSVDGAPDTIWVDGESIFDAFDTAFDETDTVMKLHRVHGVRMPRIVINAARAWTMRIVPGGMVRLYDSVPDECINMFCDGLPAHKIVLNFTSLFKQECAIRPLKMKC